MGLLVLLLLTATVHAADRPSALVPRVEQPPAANAREPDPAWSRAARLRIAEPLGENQDSRVPLATEVFLLRTDDALHLRFICANPATPQLRTRVRDRDEEAYTDESVEVFLDTQDGSDYYQFVVNASGSVYDGRKFDARWNGDWTATAGVAEGAWEATLRIPFTTLGGAPAPGSYWLLNICRNAFDVTGRAASSAWIAPGYHRPLGLVCFGDIDARPLFQRLNRQLGKLRRFEALQAKKAGDGGIAAALTALEARCPDPSNVPPDRFAALLAEAEDLERSMEPLMQQAVLRAILDAPNQPWEGNVRP